MNCHQGHRKFFLLALLCSAFLVNGVSAARPDSPSIVAEVSIGPSFESAGQTQTLSLAPGIEKAYVAQNQTNALVNGELFLGLQLALASKFQGQFGIAFAVAGAARPSGEIWDDADSTFNNYTYAYRVSHTHLSAKAKVLFETPFYQLKPFVSASLGIGFNYSSNFENTPSLFQAIATPNFAAKATSSFTYTVGAGIQKALGTDWHVGVGYEFSDWGRSELGAMTEQTTTNRLSLTHLYTNGFLFILTWSA